MLIYTLTRRQTVYIFKALTHILEFNVRCRYSHAVLRTKTFLAVSVLLKLSSVKYKPFTENRITNTVVHGLYRWRKIILMLRAKKLHYFFYFFFSCY